MVQEMTWLHRSILQEIQGLQAELSGALEEGGMRAYELPPRIPKIEWKLNILCNSFKTTWQKHQSSLPLS